MSNTMGWQCPACKRTYAPFIPSCDCQKERSLRDRVEAANRPRRGIDLRQDEHPSPREQIQALMDADRATRVRLS